MKFRAYQKPWLVGWLGWVEDEEGYAVGFVGFDGQMTWHKSELR